ncbi:MAG: alpha/beta hydrolase [Deltaproteobacteria bacterium]|nr:alpha/beta hydrolase [Deltaproteobacteria bacterium]
MHVTIRGTRIHIRQTLPVGGEREPSLVFVHGAGGDATIWDDQAAFFRGKHRVFCMELPGHGDSSGDGEDSISAYVDWVRGAIEVGLPSERIVLAGHSMGGAIALHFALNPPPALQGIVLLGSGARLGVMPAIFKMLKNDPEAFYGTIDMSAFAPSASAEIRQKVNRSIRACPPGVTLKDFRGCNGFDIRDRLREIALPSLIVCGQEDRLTPVKYSGYLHEHIPGSRLVLIPHAGHMVMAEKAEAVNEALEEFVAGLPGKPSGF